MAFQVRIQNLGKLADATVRVGGLTVLAGVNDTGKSFFSKALYSIFDAMNANLGLTEMQGMARHAQHRLGQLRGLDGGKALLPDSLIPALKRLQNNPINGMSPAANDGEIAAVAAAHARFAKIVDKIVRAYEKLRPAAGKLRKSGETFAQMGEGIKKLREDSRLSPEDIVLNGFREALRLNLLGNFQSPALSDLKQDAKQDATIDVEGVGVLSIKEEDVVSRSGFDREGLERLQQYSRVTYLESPAHWKLQSALKGRMSRFSATRGKINLAVPKHFTDLDDALNDEYSGKVAFPELLERLTGKEVMGGKIVLSESGGMLFSKSGQDRPFSLPMTATGVVNLGVLALLIERKILDEGTFLFVDEPESNLHPAWQVAMTEVLYELAQGGVNVVVATHSVDIMKRLEIYAKEEVGSTKKLVAVNHFQRDGTVRSGGVEMIRDIKRDLSNPFFQLYARGL